MEENKDYSTNSTEEQEVNPLVEEYESKFLNTSTMDKSPVVNNKGITLYASRKNDLKHTKSAYILNGLLLVFFGVIEFVIMHNLIKEMFPAFASLAILNFSVVIFGAINLIQGIAMKEEVSSKSLLLDKTFGVSLDDNNDLKVETTLMPLGYVKSVFGKLSFGCFYAIICMAILTVATEPSNSMRVLGMVLIVSVISCLIIMRRLKEAGYKTPYNKLKFYCDGYVLECTNKLRHWRKL
ncbi:MAG: hypothetical protein K6F14_07475 [Clostridiales bacterium]|nr:hypothetical protein [Clostridiales bacterium]